MKDVKKIIICFGLILCGVSAFAKGKMVPVSEGWKLHYGDNSAWKNLAAESLDSSWKTVEMPHSIPMENENGFWLKTSVKIPSELKNQNVYFEAGNSYGAMEIYIGGAMVGHHGTVSPKVNFSHVSNTIAPIPADAIVNGKVDISIRCKTQGSHQTFKQFYIVDQNRYSTVVLFQPLLNNYVYYMMAAICLFLGLYFLCQFIANKTDRASLSFSLTLGTVSVYFLDMASEVLYLPFNIQLSVARCCFVYSIGFLVLFIRNLFKKDFRFTRYIVYGLFVVVTVAYIVSANSIPKLESLFTITLAPVFAGIIYLYAMLIKALKSPDRRKAKALITGISVAMIFAIHDVVYQIIGVIPFAWLQGFSFFFIDITIFIVVSMESIENKRQISNLVASTSEQKDTLNNVIKNASRLSAETMEIATNLNEAVTAMVVAVQDTENQTQSIGEFISKQNESMKVTTGALEKLVNSVDAISNEVRVETDVVSAAVSETNLMVEGVNKAAAGIENAADFAQSLGKLTARSTNDIATLVRLLDEIKQSSAEILNVIKVVSDFSHKTNMLAMNASIEAAHSGDAGKGFAVIAHEINNLAGASGAQTEKITQIITAITENIGRSFDLSIGVKQALEQVAAGAESTAQKVSESAQGMDAQRKSGVRINEATDQMSASAQKVQAETMRQSSYSMQVSTNMEELSRYANDAETAFGEVLRRNKELTQQASDLQSLAARIKDASADLDKLINI